MKAKSAVIAGVFATGLAVIAYVMRGGRQRKYVAPPVQLGLSDGAVHTLTASDASVAELRDLAAEAGRALEAG